jgi:dynamin 1-like protein
MLYFSFLSKAIMHLLVNYSRESVQNRLVASLYKENLFEDLLYEDESLTAERTRVKNLLDAYKEAFKVSFERVFIDCFLGAI